MQGSVDHSENARAASLPEVLGAADPPPSSPRHVMSMPRPAEYPLNPASAAERGAVCLDQVKHASQLQSPGPVRSSEDCKHGP